MEIDQYWMNLALDLSRKARGRVAPNPAVGAVIVRDGQAVGQGHTEPPGYRHAEVVALDEAGDRAAGATMYVTLEPCAHHGRTPPCLDAILKAGLDRVVIAVRDPNPLVNGRSIAALREHGVEVTLGTGVDEAIQINSGFFRRLLSGRPEVHVKYAMSLDGKIATHTMNARWITGQDARTQAHMIRDQSDAILVGIGTVLADDPLLTTRLPDERAGSNGPSHPLRVIVDSQARTPVDAAMLQKDVPGTTLIVVAEIDSAGRVAALQRTGAEVVALPLVNGRVNLGALLDYLGRRGINTLMVEGGGQIIGSMVDAELIDRVTAFIAPVLLGGEGAPSPIAGSGFELADQGLRLIAPDLQQVGDDIRVSGYLDGRFPDEGLL
ncbi:MAG: bifunctional diaminohydroxyphosphoribosylaminopyrimidine deaminase/5-amino-6-(5-phosphoribosylamino)uracil reductase RibD [Thermomicrobiaceae bacterium]